MKIMVTSRYHYSSFVKTHALVHKMYDFALLVVDQNEKLLMYKLTHIVACDGYYQMITSYTIIEIKNNLTVCEKTILVTSF